MGFRVDFSNVPDIGDLPVGDYHVKVTDGQERVGKESGKPYINWELTVQSGELASRKCWTNTSLSPDALQYGLKPMLKALGLELGGDVAFKIHAEDEDEGTPIVGSDLIVTVGKARNGDGHEVKKFKAFSESASLLP